MAKRIKVKALRITPILVIVDDDDDDVVIDKDIGYQDLSPASAAQWITDSWPAVIEGHRELLKVQEAERLRNDELTMAREKRLAARRESKQRRGKGKLEGIEDTPAAATPPEMPLPEMPNAGLSAREKAAATARQPKPGRVTPKRQRTG